MKKEKEKQFDTVTLDLDDGRTVECDVLGIFPVNFPEGVKDYIALIDSKAGEDGEIWFYGCKKKKNDPDDYDLIDIESDDEFDAVADAFDELLDEEEADEAFGELMDDEDEDEQ